MTRRAACLCGPSLATVEDTVVEPNGMDGTSTKQITASGSPRPHISVVREFAWLSNDEQSVFSPASSSMSSIFFFSNAARSDGHEVGKKTTTSRQRGEPSKTKQTQKTTQNKQNQTPPTKRLSKKARTKVKRCETCFFFARCCLGKISGGKNGVKHAEMPLKPTFAMSRQKLHCTGL